MASPSMNGTTWTTLSPPPTSSTSRDDNDDIPHQTLLLPTTNGTWIVSYGGYNSNKMSSFGSALNTNNHDDDKNAGYTKNKHSSSSYSSFSSAGHTSISRFLMVKNGSQPQGSSFSSSFSATNNNNNTFSHNQHQNSALYDSKIRVMCLVDHHELDSEHNATKNNRKLNSWTVYPERNSNHHSADDKNRNGNSTKLNTSKNNIGFIHHAGTITKTQSLSPQLNPEVELCYSNNNNNDDDDDDNKSSKFIQSLLLSRENKEERDENIPLVDLLSSSGRQKNENEKDEEEETSFFDKFKTVNNRDILLAQLRSHKMVIHGGFSSFDDKLSSDLLKFDFRTCKWHRMPTNGGTDDAPLMFGHFLSSTKAGEMLEQDFNYSSSSTTTNQNTSNHHDVLGSGGAEFCQYFVCGPTLVERSKLLSKTNNMSFSIDEVTGNIVKNDKATVAFNRTKQKMLYMKRSQQQGFSTLSSSRGTTKRKQRDDDNDEEGEEDDLAVGYDTKEDLQVKNEILRARKTFYTFSFFLYTSFRGQSGWHELGVLGNEDVTSRLTKKSPRCHFSCSRVDSLAVYNNNNTDNDYQQEQKKQVTDLLPTQEFFYLVGGEDVNDSLERIKKCTHFHRQTDETQSSSSSSSFSNTTNHFNNFHETDILELRLFTHEKIVLVREVRWGHSLSPSNTADNFLLNNSESPLPRALMKNHLWIREQLSKIQRNKDQQQQQSFTTNSTSSATINTSPYGFSVCSGKECNLAELVLALKKVRTRKEIDQNYEEKEKQQEEEEVIQVNNDDEDEEENNSRQQQEQQQAEQKDNNNKKGSQMEILDQMMMTSTTATDNLLETNHHQREQNQNNDNNNNNYSNDDDENSPEMMVRKFCGIRKRDWNRTPVFFFVTPTSVEISFIVHGGSNSVEDGILDVPLVSLPLHFLEKNLEQDDINNNKVSSSSSRSVFMKTATITTTTNTTATANTIVINQIVPVSHPVSFFQDLEGHDQKQQNGFYLSEEHTIGRILLETNNSLLLSSENDNQNDVVVDEKNTARSIFSLINASVFVGVGRLGLGQNNSHANNTYRRRSDNQDGNNRIFLTRLWNDLEKSMF